MKLLTTLALFYTALLAHAVSIPADLAFPLKSRETCSSPPGENGCGYGRECGDGPGYTCSPAGQIVAIACCGPNGCKRINEQPYCV
ncbi:hypothetical protein VC83_03245 [Pseudogymnoascus destructans]|uniref:Uncharacterized protein n=1 Tax=Pseudogymnoascus destructans TaxID=655981 RepID=A0A177AE38_9PEZI|nr:uncharacterized protein VC83_03245 [Pseudogymnoascus destructans]OAF60368.1 hypothetical protein VC83_03245 [Pseudogymnoascus destructans]